jgi:hypothetical protein
VSIDVYNEDIPTLDKLLGGAEVMCHKLFGNTNGNGADGMRKWELELDGNRTGCRVTIRAD